MYRVDVITTTMHYSPPYHDGPYRSESVSLLLAFRDQVTICTVKHPNPVGMYGPRGLVNCSKRWYWEGVSHCGVSTH
uniref:Putative ovule protein n=1 Tax=Solanum chacoense TaxID=4108 RepID=A0A0V0GPM6_SOLCH